MTILSVSAEKPAAQEEFYGREGKIKYAGMHLLAEFWNAKYLTDANRIRKILIKAIEACGATMLSIDLHVFSPNGGISGVAVLKESHISIHTWPELGYAAIDIFVCGRINPRSAMEYLESEFQPERAETTEIKRGIIE